MVRLVDLALRDGGDLGQLDPVVDLQQLLGILQLERVDGPLVGAHDRQHVGQVVLALGVVGPHLLQRHQQRVAVEREHARVDLADLTFVLGRVAVGLGLGHPLDRPVRRSDHPPIAGRIRQLDGHDRRRRMRPAVRLDQRAQRLGPHQRHVAVDHHHRLIGADQPRRRLDRVSRAARLTLDHQLHPIAGHRLQLPLRRVDDHDAPGTGRPRRGDRPLHDRPAAHRVQQLLTPTSSYACPDRRPG